jgi:hypothetical protein
MWFSKIKSWLSLRREFHIKQAPQHAYAGFLKSQTTLSFINTLELSTITPQDLMGTVITVPYRNISQFNSKLIKTIDQIQKNDYIDEHSSITSVFNLDEYFVDTNNVPISLQQVSKELNKTFGALTTALAEKQNTPKYDYYQRFLLKPSIDGLQITEALASLVERQCDMSFWTYCTTLLRESQKHQVL